jgi:DNA-binding NtrC family response regulator
MSNEIILIVNDDDDISSLFADALQIEGFKTIKSNNASLALEEMKLRPNEFAAVLVDKTSQTGDFAECQKYQYQYKSYFNIRLFVPLTLKSLILIMTDSYNCPLRLIN